MKNKLTLSIVVPVYNERERLRNCLDAIAAQTILPEKVIIVDNNSTDGSMKIAEEYPFVEIISEQCQGIVFARNAGFDQVKSDIIGRIDADTILAPNWAERALEFFQANPKVSAVTGDSYFYDFPARRATKLVHHLFYYTLQRPLLMNYALWGSNMALRRDDWQQVRNSCTDDPKEDIDLTIHLSAIDKRTARDKGLRAEVSMRRGSFDPRALYEYLLPWPYTFWRNKLYVGAITIYGLLAIIFLFLLPAAALLKLTQILRLSYTTQFEDD